MSLQVRRAGLDEGVLSTVGNLHEEVQVSLRHPNTARMNGDVQADGGGLAIDSQGNNDIVLMETGVAEPPEDG